MDISIGVRFDSKEYIWINNSLGPNFTQIVGLTKQIHGIWLYKLQQKLKEVKILYKQWAAEK